MMVDTKAHESAVDKVDVGLEARITIDAFPDQYYRGEVSKVAVLPDSQSRWLNPDLKVYSTDITLFEGNEKLKPGMSAKVEIIVQSLSRVVYVPIQCVYRRGGREVCYVTGPGLGIEVRPVKVGLTNDQFVEVREGLTEGEQVLLYAPAIGDDQGAKSEEGAAGAEPGAGSGEEEIRSPENRGADSAGEAREEDSRRRSGRRDEGSGAEGGAPPSAMGERSLGGFDPSAVSEEDKKKFEEFMKLTPEERMKRIEQMRSEGKIPDFSSGGGGMGRGSGSDRRSSRSSERDG